MGIDVNSQTGIAKEIINLMGAGKKQTLDAKEESVFNAVNNAAETLINSGNLTFTKIYRTLYDVGKNLLSYFSNNFYKLAKFCKNLANKILELFSDKRNQSGTREDIVTAAQSYVGLVPDRRTGNLLFSNGVDEAWCADTASTILEDVAGNWLPDDFGSHSVQGLMDWGKGKGCFADTSKMSLKDAAKYVAKNIKPGDLMIEKRNGSSHVRIVTKVYEDGSFDVVEGNSSNRLTSNHIRVDMGKYNSYIGLSGFVRTSQYVPEATKPRLSDLCSLEIATVNLDDVFKLEPEIIVPTFIEPNTIISEEEEEES